MRRLFAPLGYAVALKGSQLDDKFLEWGDSPYVALSVSGTVRLQDLLTHLYMLIPVLDNEKHYWVANDEVETSGFAVWQMVSQRVVLRKCFI